MQPEDHDQELYQLPEAFRESAEIWARAGLARSAEELWTYAIGPRAPEMNSGSTAFEFIVAGIVRAHPPVRNDQRTADQRFRAAMEAMFGSHYRAGKNDHDDRAALAEMAWMIEVDEPKSPNIVAAARTALTNLDGTQAENDSSVRRLERKYRADPAAARSLATGVDDIRQTIQEQAIQAIAKLLRSVGVPVELQSHPSPHVDLSREK